MNEIEIDKLAKVLNEDVIIINDEPFYRILNGTNYDYAPIPKQFKSYFERLQSQLEQKEKQIKELEKIIQEYSDAELQRQEDEMMDYLIKEEEKFNDYSFMED